MSKKRVEKAGKPLSPRPAAKRADTAYPVEQEDLDEQQRRLRKAATAGAEAMRTPAPAAMAERSSTPAALLSKPLAPLGALWPSSVPPRGEATPSQGTAPQKAPIAAIAPRPAPATAAPLPQPPAQSLPPTSPEKAAVAAPGMKATAPKTLGVRFALDKPDAKGVSVCGEFNGR